MIDEKRVIRKIEKKIDTFVKDHPEQKDCKSVQVQKEFIHMLELEAKEQTKKEHECELSLESELLGKLNDMRESKEAFCDKRGDKCELYESCFKCAIEGMIVAVKQLEQEHEYSYADFDEYVREVAPYFDAEHDNRFCEGIRRAIMIIRAISRTEMSQKGIIAKW